MWPARHRRACAAAPGNREISIGDYVITGGELAALVVIGAVTLHSGVLGIRMARMIPHFRAVEYRITPPPEFRWRIPEVLLGDHGQLPAGGAIIAVAPSRQRA
jgi:tRNA (guanine37-N1)-methyltransferase